MKESELYSPLKNYLETQNYEIKGEVGGCDVFAIREDEPPLIVELKLSLNLTVILQAVDRLSLSSSVYIGVPKKCSALKQKHKGITKLLRMLGIGLITIDPLGHSVVKVLLDPGDYKPRISNNRQLRLLGEFEKRVGDPNLGGSDSQQSLVTAYRQSALKIAVLLEKQGPTKASDVAFDTKEIKARNILYRDVYGWFDKVERGIYQLSPRGEREIKDWQATKDDEHKL